MYLTELVAKINQLGKEDKRRYDKWGQGIDKIIDKRVKLENRIGDLQYKVRELEVRENELQAECRSLLGIE